MFIAIEPCKCSINCENVSLYRDLSGLMHHSLVINNKYSKQLHCGGINIGIKYDFPFINMHQVPRGVLKTEGIARSFQHSPRDLANVDE